MRRYRVLFQQDHQTFHALPVSSTYMDSKEDLYYKESFLHGDFIYSLGMTAGTIKRYPVKMDAPAPLFPDYPTWINSQIDNEIIESIALDGDTLLLCITQTNPTSQQILRCVNLIDQSKGPVYDIQSTVDLEKIELMDLEGQKYLLASSSQSSRNIFLALYPPQENTISFSPIASFSDTILCWDQDTNELIAHLSDQNTHLVSFFIAPKDGSVQVQKQQTIPSHVFFRFYNPQILLSSKNGDILLWESTMGGSSWIFNKHSSKEWYTLHQSIHSAAVIPSSLEKDILEGHPLNTSFLTSLNKDNELGFQITGTVMLNREVLQSED